MKKTNKIIYMIFMLLIIISISQISYAANLASDEYKITTKQNTNYIIGIYPNTRAEKVKSNLKTDKNINIYDKNGQMLKEDAIVATGNQIQIGQETYIAIVCGDANADGNASLTDLVKIKSHLIGKEILTGATGIATDVDASGKTTSTDILNLKRLLVRIIEEREIFEGKYSNSEYAYKKNKLTDKITITELKDSTASGTLQIPSKIDGNEVKEINGFLGENSKITKVTIPTGIEKISNTAFSGLTKLQEIEVSGLNEKYSSEDGILYNKEKDTLVFYPRGKANTEYTIKAEVKKLGQYAFYKNSTIQKLYIPDTVQDFEKNAFEEMQGKVYVKEGAKLIAKLKEKGISYAIDAKPEVTKLTSVEGTNQVITLNIEGTDDEGIVAWGVVLKGSQNIQWKEISQTKRFSTTYKEINQNGTYVVSLKDTVGNIGTKEIIINGIDNSIPRMESIKIISPTSGEYKPGQKVVIRVQFSEKIKGTAPTLKLKIGSTSITATATNPTGTLDYIDYTCATNEQSIGKIEVESYTGGSITDVSGNKASIVKLANTGNSIEIISNEVNMGSFFSDYFMARYPENKPQYKEKKFGYWLYIPDLSVVKTYKNIPLIVYLHGHNECGTNLDYVLKRSLPKFIKDKTIKPKAIVVMPQTPENTDWQPDVIMTLINKLKKEYDINPDKISITGHSLGGCGTWNVARKYQNEFSACVPVSLWVNMPLNVSEFPNCRTRFIFESYGYDEAKTKVKNFRERVIKEKGSKYANIFTVEIIPNTDHGAVSDVYKNTDLIQWMINQTRGKL